MPEALSDLGNILDVLNDVDIEDVAHQPWPGGTQAEYTPEARILLLRVVEEPLTAEYVRDVWLVMYASGEREVQRSSGRGRHGIVRQTWVGDMPMRPEFGLIAERVNALFPQRKR